MTEWASRVTAGLPRARRRGATDPFTALEVQLALGRLEAEIARIQADDVSFGRAHHLYAALAAYDHALDEACRLAGVTGLPATPRERRAEAERRLQVLGWWW